MIDPNMRKELDAKVFEDSIITLAVSVWKGYYTLPDQVRGDHDSYELIVAQALAELAIPPTQADKIGFLAKIEAQAQSFL